MEYSSIFVCLMGMGTVFFGLICLIALTYLMSAVVGRGKKAAPAPVPAAPQTAGEVTGSRRIRRAGGGTGHRHHRHPHRFHEKSVRRGRNTHEKVQSHRQRDGL